jgi:hypothetical protein
MKEKAGTFNKKIPPVKPNRTKIIAVKKAFSKVVCRVVSNELLPNKSANTDRLIPKINGNNK